MGVQMGGFEMEIKSEIREYEPQTLQHSTSSRRDKVAGIINESPFHSRRIFEVITPKNNPNEPASQHFNIRYFRDNYNVGVIDESGRVTLRYDPNVNSALDLKKLAKYLDRYGVNDYIEEISDKTKEKLRESGEALFEISGVKLGL